MSRISGESDRADSGSERIHEHLRNGERHWGRKHRRRADDHAWGESPETALIDRDQEIESLRSDVKRLQSQLIRFGYELGVLERAVRYGR